MYICMHVGTRPDGWRARFNNAFPRTPEGIQCAGHKKKNALASDLKNGRKFAKELEGRTTYSRTLQSLRRTFARREGVAAGGWRVDEEQAGSDREHKRSALSSGLVQLLADAE